MIARATRILFGLYLAGIPLAMAALLIHCLP